MSRSKTHQLYDYLEGYGEIVLEFDLMPDKSIDNLVIKLPRSFTNNYSAKQIIDKYFQTRFPMYIEGKKYDIGVLKEFSGEIDGKTVKVKNTYKLVEMDKKEL